MLIKKTNKIQGIATFLSFVQKGNIFSEEKESMTINLRSCSFK